MPAVSQRSRPIRPESVSISHLLARVASKPSSSQLLSLTISDHPASLATQTAPEAFHTRKLQHNAALLCVYRSPQFTHRASVTEMRGSHRGDADGGDGCGRQKGCVCFIASGWAVMKHLGGVCTGCHINYKDVVSNY